MARKAPLSGLLIEVAGYYTYPESTPLADGTPYLVVLTGALSTTGQPLDRPYAFTFTTGSR